MKKFMITKLKSNIAGDTKSKNKKGKVVGFYSRVKYEKKEPRKLKKGVPIKTLKYQFV